MRPLELKLRNFRSYYGDDARFIFRDRSLVGVVGPIGSGKSSILDAIAYALYGKTPSVAAATKTLIHQRASEGAVSLRFEVEGEVYEVVRSLRRKGASQHALYRYATDDPEPEVIDTITQEGDVNAAIIDLLGLEFDAFSRSVLLAQGRFAEFLSSQPADRDKVLKGVFGHDRVDRMREIAKGRTAELKATVATLDARVEHLERVMARLVDQREQLKQVGERLESLRKAEPAVTDLEARIVQASKGRDQAKARLERLAEHADDLPRIHATEQMLTEVVEAREQRHEAATALEAALAEAAEADQIVKRAEAGGVSGLIETAATTLAALNPLQMAAQDAAGRVTRYAKRAEGANATAADAEVRLERATSTADAAQKEVEKASAGVMTAESALHTAQHVDMAATLRSELRGGDLCPVCQQAVTTPPAVAEVDLGPAEQELESAKKAQRLATAAATRAHAESTTAREALDTARATAEGATTELEAAATAVAEHEEAVAACIASLEGSLGEGDPEANLARVRADFQSKVDEATARRKSADRARVTHDGAIRAEQESDKRLTALRVDVVEMAGRLGEELAPPGDDPAAVQAAVVTLETRWDAVTTALQLSYQEETKAADETSAELDERLDALDAGDSLVVAMADAEARADVLAGEVGASEELLEEGKDVGVARDEATAALERLQRVASDLTNSRFIRYLLDDERSRLAELGSEHFERLSSGRYRFTEDGAFSIIDLTAADAVRKTDSLSGGETFLASLGLALALAEMVIRTGGRLDAFFLDEGFGTLDPEHLDLAMDGVEELATDGAERLVVVVSHVPELRHRLEDLIELDRDPTTGDTRVISA